jgi:hypothetical protein
MTKHLDDIFNVQAVDVTPRNEETINTPAIVQPAVSSEQQSLEDDYSNTRGNLYALLQHGQDALTHALEVAKQSEHPRAFEVVGNLVKQLADVNHQLLDLTEKKQKISGSKSKESPAAIGGPSVTNNNAFFVGSTAELNKLVSNMITGDKQ